MSLWLVLSLFAPLVFSASIFVDKYLLGKLAKNSPGVITVLAGVAGFPIMVIFWFLARDQIADFGLGNASLAFTAGILISAAYFLYYKALIIADASLAAALFQLIVVFNYVFGLLFLDEVLSAAQLGAISLVVVGSLLLTLETKEGKWRIRKRVLGYMVLSSLLISISGTIFAYVSRDTSYWPAQFYDYASTIILALVVLAVSSNVRRGFGEMLKQNGRQALLVSQGNEILNTAGLFAMRYAMFLAPIALVQAVQSVQPVYLLILGFLLTKFFPRWIKENVKKDHLLRKIVSITIIIVGTVLIAVVS